MTTLAVNSMKIGERYMFRHCSANPSWNSGTLDSKFEEPEVQYIFNKYDTDGSLHTIPKSFVSNVFVFAHPRLPWSINRIISEYV